MTALTQTVFNLLRASLFTDEALSIPDWEPVFTEMKRQTVAALPGEWLKMHPVSPSWPSYCALQQAQWIRVMSGQDALLKLLEEHNIPCVIIKGAAAAMAYPHPMLRTMGDVDVLVKRADLDRAADLLEANGYKLTQDKDFAHHHYNYSKDGISFELHKRVGIVADTNEALLTRFERGIDSREWHETEGYRFPALPTPLNGLVLIFHVNQHLRSGLGLRQIVDWMMYVNRLTAAEWDMLQPLLQSTGMERLALTVTVMCQRYLGLRTVVAEDDGLPCEALMAYIMEKGNFGRKAGIEGKTAAFTLTADKKGSTFRRLQRGGMLNWKAAQKHKILQPFAWIYQSFRILGLFAKNRMSLINFLAQRKKGKAQRKLLEDLGLKVEMNIKG